MRPNRKALCAIAAIIVVALAGALLHGRGAVSGSAAGDAVAVVTGGSPTRQAARATAIAPPSRTPPPEIIAALDLGPGSRFRQPIALDAKRSIYCGEVSADGSDRSYRRFVFNRPGGTGAVDDGTPLFDKFARKICSLR